MKKYTFQRYTDTSKKIVWADSCVTASDMVGVGWNLFTITK